MGASHSRAQTTQQAKDDKEEQRKAELREKLRAKAKYSLRGDIVEGIMHGIDRVFDNKIGEYTSSIPPEILDAGAKADDALGYHCKLVNTLEIKNEVCDRLHDLREKNKAFDTQTEKVEATLKSLGIMVKDAVTIDTIHAASNAYKTWRGEITSALKTLISQQKVIKDTIAAFPSLKPFSEQLSKISAAINTIDVPLLLETMILAEETKGVIEVHQLLIKEASETYTAFLKKYSEIDMREYATKILKHGDNLLKELISKGEAMNTALEKMKQKHEATIKNSGTSGFTATSSTGHSPTRSPASSGSNSPASRDSPPSSPETSVARSPASFVNNLAARSAAVIAARQPLASASSPQTSRNTMQ